MKKRIYAAVVAGTMLTVQTAGALESQIPAWLDPSAGAVTVPTAPQTQPITPPLQTPQVSSSVRIPSTGQPSGTPGTVTTNTGEVYPTYWLGMSVEEATQYLVQQDPELANAEMLTYAQIEPLVRTQNRTVLANRATLDGIKAVDLDKAIADLQNAIRNLEQAAGSMQELTNNVILSLSTVNPMVENGQATLMIGSATTVLLQSNIAQLEAQITQLKEQVKSLKKTDYEPYERQFAMIENQLVMAAQSAYMGLMTLQQNYIMAAQKADLTDVKLREMETRLALGQVSQLNVDEVKRANTQAHSAVRTLSQTLYQTKGDLSLLLGRDPARNYMLDALPAVTPDMIARMRLESDLAAAMEQSYDIYTAEKALKDAKDLDDEDEGRKDKIRAAEYTLEGAEAAFEQNFHKLFRTVAEKNRLLSVAQETLGYQVRATDAAKLKYEKGTISRNAYLEADVAKSEAETNVLLAQIDLYSAYMQYQWACQGVMSTTGGM